MPTDEELVQAAGRIKALLNLLHSMKHTEQHHSDDLEGHFVTAHVLADHDLLELMNEEAEVFEDYKDLAEHLFHQVYLQAQSIAELTISDFCSFINWQLDNIDQELGKWN